MTGYTIEDWECEHPRIAEFERCVFEAAPEQAPFIFGEYSRGIQCCLLVALVGDRVVGFLRFGIQPIGREEGCPMLQLSGKTLTEAKIHAFAVLNEARGQGIGTDLQRSAMDLARRSGCHQLSSHSSYDRHANVRVKLKLGFAAHPEANGGIRFLKPLA